MNVVEQLDKARATLVEERENIARLLAEADACAVRAVMHFEKGQHEQAKKALTKGCDLEFEALIDCEALGGLMDALYPEYEESG